MTDEQPSMDEDPLNADMASAMGFASFGSQPKAKRHKPDHPSSSRLNGQTFQRDLANLPSKPPRPKSGAKSMPRREQHNFAASAGQMESHVPQDNPEDNATNTDKAQNSEPVLPGLSSSVGRTEQGVGTDDGIMHGMKHEKATLASTLAHLPPKPSHQATKSVTYSAPLTPEATLNEARPSTSSNIEPSTNLRSSNPQHLPARLQGNHDQRGGNILGFYKPSFVEDPWEKLLSK